LFGAGLAAGFGAVHLLLGGGAYFQQLWVSHFGAARSFEYGSPAEHPFDWSILLKNWDATLPAILGIVVSWRQRRLAPAALVPGAWLALVLVVHALHRPWWSYYCVHLSLPLCWNAAIGLAAAWRWIRLRKTPLRAVSVGLWVLGAVAWMGGRLYLQISGIRDLPQTYCCLALSEIARYKPHTEWMYAAEPIYSFHAGIPLPPNLAVVPLKRLWSGQMNNARIAAEMASVKPGIILLRNDAREVPFADLVSAEYRLVYMDAEHLLYVRRGLARKASW